MQETPGMPDVAAETTAGPASANEDWGWYLYGITRNQGQTAERADNGAGAVIALEGEEQLDTVTSGDLAAVVRRVPLVEFAPEALRERADDPAWLERMARRHNAVVEAVHQTRAILPATFGSVYAGAEDVRTALAEEHDALLARLSWIEGCDEWGVRLYGDVATIRQRADEGQASTRRLRDELQSASPGRAYFLQRKLADERVGALDSEVERLVGRAYEHMAHHARAGQISKRLVASRIEHDRQHVEIMRAAFLVPRAESDAFIEDVRQFSESQAGQWCEYSGPWPPYSFAAQSEVT